MRNHLPIILSIILLAFSPADSATVYLKNGGVIKNVLSYEKSAEKTLLWIKGGSLEIPSGEVLRIDDDKPASKGKKGKTKKESAPKAEKSTPPAFQEDHRDAQFPQRRDEGRDGGRMQTPPPAPEVPYAPQQPSYYKQRDDERAGYQLRLDAVKQRISEIETQEKKLDAVKTEYDEVKLRIEVLFQKGVAGAKNAGKDMSMWLSYLSPQEQGWAQMNTIRKPQLEDEIFALSNKIAPMRAEKARLIEEKGSLEEKIRRLE